MEENEEFKKKFMLKCPVCGKEFYSWHAFGVTSDKTNWKQFLYCPNCHSFDDKDNYRNTYLETININ